MPAQIPVRARLTASVVLLLCGMLGGVAFAQSGGSSGPSSGALRSSSAQPLPADMASASVPENESASPQTADSTRALDEERPRDGGVRPAKRSPKRKAR